MKISNILIVSAGVLLPAIVFFISTPFLIAQYSIELFGFISLMLVFLSAANVFDIGMSRAVTNYCASECYDKNSCVVVSLNTFIFFLILILVAVVYLLFVFFASLFSADFEFIRKITESRVIFLNLLLCIPLVVSFSIFRGAIEGRGEFKNVTYLKVYSSLYTVALLIIGSYYSSDLLVASLAILLSRLIMLIQVMFVARGYIDFKFRFNENLKKIMKYGAYASVSNFISAFLVHSDRVFASVMFSPKVFSIYSAIIDLITRFTFIPGSISTVLFVSSSVGKDANDFNYLRKCFFLLSVTVLPISVFFHFFGVFFIEIWLSSAGAEIPDLVEYKNIISLVSLGFLINSFAHIPYAVIQAKGFVNFTAYLHVSEAIIFIPIMFVLVMHFGIYGLLFSWVARHLFDFVFLMFFMVRKCL